MLARIRKSMEKKDNGFTLIELLVVMVIIGILAAIAIPSFINQRSKARQTAALTDASNIGKSIATYYVDGTGALSLTSASQVWTLKDANNNVIDSGKLSGGEYVGTTYNSIQLTGSATSWCALVLTGTSGDKMAQVNNTGAALITAVSNPSCSTS